MGKAKTVQTVRPSYVATRVVEYIDWGKVPNGEFVICENVVGQIIKLPHNSIGILNNTHGNYRINEKRLMGYRYCFTLTTTHMGRCKLYSELPKGVKIPEIPIQIADYNVVFHKGYIQLGCKKITNDKILDVVSRLIE